MITNSLASSKSGNTSGTAIAGLLQDIVGLRQEHFVCLTFDSGDRLIAKRTVFIGTLTSVIAHPREIFACAIDDHAAYIIVAHNHPSGDPMPSKDDIATTKQLMAAGKILGIPLEDHIIIGDKEHFSFLDHGYLRSK